MYNSTVNFLIFTYLEDKFLCLAKFLKKKKANCTPKRLAV